jgi:uncharacterized protein (TIGR02118 family)
LAKIFVINPAASGRDIVTPLAGAVRRLSVSAPVRTWTGMPSPNFEGRFECAYYDDERAMLAAYGADSLADLVADGLHWPVAERIILDGAPADGAVKMTAMVMRKAGMHQAAFTAHYRDVHAPLVRKTPHLIRYVQNDILPVRSPYDLEFDAVAELWWNSFEEGDRSWNSPEIQEEQKVDMRNFAGGGRSLFVIGIERRVV